MSRAPMYHIRPIDKLGTSLGERKKHLKAIDNSNSGLNTMGGCCRSCYELTFFFAHAYFFRIVKTKSKTEK